MGNQARFTKELLLTLPLPEAGKRATLYDTGQTRLALRVTSAGSKTFYVVKRVAERMVWYKLGVFPDMTVDQAREATRAALTEYAQGKKPDEIRRAHRQELTFAELFNEFGERHGSKKRSWPAMVSLNTNHLAPMARMKLSAIDKGTVSRILSNVERAGLANATVNYVRALISSVFSKAIEWGYAAENPVLGVKTRAKVKRDRFLQADELPRFFKSLAVESNPTLRDYILLALLTGARRANLLAMRWADIRMDEAIWRIPMTKNGTPQNVTLSPEAFVILAARREVADKDAVYVFPGVGKSGHIEEPKKAVIRVMERAGIPYGRKDEYGVTLHDLRRTLGSWQAKTGASLAIIGKSLNHQSPQATAIYARLDTDPVRAAVNTATAAMLEAGGVTETAEVIRLGRKAR